MPLRLGIALGSGAARGWAHIGVLRALEEMGVRPRVMCGTSVGAVVGAAYLTEQLDELRAWGQKMNLLGFLKMADLTFSRGGLVAVEKAFELFRNASTDIEIQMLPGTFGVVATDLATGREVWLREGPMLDVIRASAAMPGLFPAVKIGDQWLVDGALVNPVPVSLCRALGASAVIAVNLNSELSVLPQYAAPSDPVVPTDPAEEPEPLAPPAPHLDHAPNSPLARFVDKITATMDGGKKFLTSLRERPPTPGVLEIVAGSLDIMQDRITRARLAGDPPEVLIAPKVGHIGILDFDRADELIEIGYAATLAQSEKILKVAGRQSALPLTG